MSTCCAGASETVLGHEVRAPSTIGTWLRGFTWGHVRQLDAAAGAVLTRAWALGAGPGRDEPVTMDMGSTHCETYGLGKHGAWKINRDGERGYHLQVAVLDGYDQVLGVRLREGTANDGRGASSFVASPSSGRIAGLAMTRCPRGGRQLRRPAPWRRPGGAHTE